MKIISSVLILLACIGSHSLSSQTPFEGKITTRLTALNLPENAKGMESMLNKTITTYVLGENARMEENSVMGSTVIISSGTKKEMIMLMDMMGKKIAMALPMDDPNGKKTESTGKIEVTAEKKTIAGYTCTKAIFTDTEKPSFKSEIWFTKELSNVSGKYKMIDGMPMEYKVYSDDIIMLYTVTDVHAEKVNPSVFEIPEGYTLQTKEDMERLIPSMGNE